MYCTHCGVKQPEEASYCSACGTRLMKGKPVPSALPAQPETEVKEAPKISLAKEPVRQAVNELPSVLLSQNGRSGKGSSYRYPEPKPTFAARYGSLLTLLCLVVMIAGGWYAWSSYKSGIVEQASLLQTEAGALAQQGQYQAAQIKLEEAAKLLPNDTSISTDKESLHAASRAQSALVQVALQMDSHKLDEAEKNLAQIEAELGDGSNTLLNREKEAAADQRQRLGLLHVRTELDAADDVGKLAALMDDVEKIDTDEAREVQDLIVEKIVSVSSRQAEQLLKEEKYASASKVVDTALGYAKADSALIVLNGRIEIEEREAEERQAEAEVKAEERRQAAVLEAEEKRKAEEEAMQNRQVEQEAAQAQAEYTVQEFYNNLSAWNYSGAYALLGSRWQKNTGYSDFVNGYTNTSSVWIDSIDSAQGDENTEVTILITAEESSDLGTVYSRYRSVYQVGYENGIMKILSGKGEKLS